MWAMLGLWLEPVYQQLHEEVNQAEVLHADETSWRVNGQTYWLWGFGTQKLVFYTIRPSRGAVVVAEVLGKKFDGVLCCDFFGAYNAIDASAKQRCVVHLRRELKKVSQSNQSDEWKRFRKRLKQILTQAENWRAKRDELSEYEYEEGAKRLFIRLVEFVLLRWQDKDAERIRKRLSKYLMEILMFLFTDAPPDNNLAEREIRPAVIMRKNSYGNMSPNGANTQAILMSIFRTLHKRQKDPIEWVTTYLQQRLQNKDHPKSKQKVA